MRGSAVTLLATLRGEAAVSPPRHSFNASAKARPSRPRMFIRHAFATFVETGNAAIFRPAYRCL